MNDRRRHLGVRTAELLGEPCTDCDTWRRRTARGKLFRCRSTACKDKARSRCTALPGCDRMPSGRNGDICDGHAQQRTKGKPFTPLRPKKGHNETLLRDETGRKHCRGCDKWYHVSEFRAQKVFADGLGLYCRDCRLIRELIRYYNLSLEDYQAMVLAQNGACAICQRAPEGRLHVDHDHRCCPEKKRSCGKCIRGLLCGTCNCAIGMLREDEQLFLRAAEYIKVRSLV